MNAQPAAQPAAQPHPAAALPAHLRRIVLTGFMGAGKTTVGRLLAARLNWDFLDLDAYIESRAGLSVPSIFSAHGEAHFRQLESAALASALGRNRLVLALGGGAPEVLTNRLLLEQTPATATVFLDAPFPTLFDRCMMQALNPTPASAEPAPAPAQPGPPAPGRSARCWPTPPPPRPASSPASPSTAASPTSPSTPPASPPKRPSPPSSPASPNPHQHVRASV